MKSLLLSIPEEDGRLLRLTLIALELRSNLSHLFFCVNPFVRCLAWFGAVSSLTRAAGAAQRVLSLMDSMPDIDIDSGLVIDDKDFRGEIGIQGVEFTYQMRPDNQVSLLP